MGRVLHYKSVPHPLLCSVLIVFPWVLHHCEANKGLEKDRKWCAAINTSLSSYL